MLAASLRADGSSVLAKGHKWGYFPSVAVAWRVSDENFMESTRDWLDNLKLRASWGSTGNAGISAYQTLPMVNADNQIYYEFGSGVTTGRIPTTLGNENLTWETTTSYNFGVDFGFGVIVFMVVRTFISIRLKTCFMLRACPCHQFIHMYFQTLVRPKDTVLRFK